MDQIKSIYNKIQISGLYNNELIKYSEANCLDIFQKYLKFIKSVECILEPNRIVNHYNNQIWWRFHIDTRIQELYHLLDIPEFAKLFDILPRIIHIRNHSCVCLKPKPANEGSEDLKKKKQKQKQSPNLLKVKRRKVLL